MGLFLVISVVPPGMDGSVSSQLLDGDSLLVMGVTLMDTGHYTCRARNRYGQVESTARITALSKLHFLV